MNKTTDFDSAGLRAVLAAFTTGVTVITTCDSAGKCHGLTANSFSSVSLDPPLVLWSQSKTSASLNAFSRSKYFTVNILSDEQVDISQHFAKPSDDKIAGVEHFS